METAEFFVASAGLGLRRFDLQAPAYDASFAQGPDQVSRRIESDLTIVSKNRLWWEFLNRELQEVALPLSQRPEQKTVLVAGSDYVAAMYSDISALAEKVGPDRFLLISAGSAKISGVAASCLLPVNGSAAKSLGVPLIALNASLLLWAARKAGAKSDWSFAEIRCAASHELGATLATKQSHRRLTDLDVLNWISQNKRFPASSNSALLRDFRDSGLACEQSRFRRLAMQARLSGAER